MVRFRKPFVDLPSTPPFSNPTSITETIALVEHQIYSDGLSGTLAHYRQKWTANGKQGAWKTFAAALPKLWPSGEILRVPPVHSERGVKLSVQLATIDCMKEYGETPFSPLNGTEAWTRDDDRVWDVVEVEDDDDSPSSHASNEEEDFDEALHRRDSVVSVLGFTMSDSVVAWLEHVNDVPAVSPALSEPFNRCHRDD